MSLISTPTVADQVAIFIRELIVRGDYEEGERLNEVKLASTLGVSRGPIREAFFRLANDGLVELIPRRGAFIPRANSQSLQDIYDVRIALDCASASLAAVRADSRSLEQLNVLGRETGETPSSDHESEYPVGLDLHLEIAKLTGNNYLVEKVIEVTSRLSVVRARSRMSPRRTHDAHSEHVEVIRAIQSGDPAAAFAAMQKHDLNAAAFYERQSQDR